MKKRNIFTACLAGILAVTAFAAFGCGDKTDGVNPYQNFQTAITSYKSDATLFSQHEIFGTSTNFYFNNFKYKTDSGSLVLDDENYLALNAVAMNFVEKYYVELENLQADDYSVLHDALQGLNASYEVVKIDNKNLVNADSSANYEIYNGFFAKYKNSALGFVNNAFSTALTLGNFLYNAKGVEAQMLQESCDTTVTNFFIDYQLLKVYDDYRVLILDSAQGQELDTCGLYNTASSYLSIYSYLYEKTPQLFTTADRQGMLDFFKYVDGERAITRTSLANFSLYRFVKVFDQSTVAYSKENQFAENYYNQIVNYFSGQNAYMQQLY